MCEDHSEFAFREAGKLVRAPSGGDEQARPASREFAGLKLGGTREAVYHCDDHKHVVGSDLTRLIGIGIGIAVLGVIVLLFAFLPGLVLLLAGAALAGIAFGVRKMREQEASASLPPLPLVPHVNTVEVVEQVTGKVRLETAGYTSQVENVEGEIKLNMSANDGPKRLELYRKKHRLPEDDPVEFAAGYAVLEGKAGLRFAPRQPAVLAGRTGMSFGGDSADDHDLFAAVPGRAPGDWTLAVGYELQDGRVPKEIPLWIVPSLVPASDRRTLEIDLHWNQLGPEGRQNDIQLFDLIELEVPSRWGNVEGISPGRAEIARSGQRRVIKWQRLKPRDDDSQQSKSRTLTIRFEREVTEEPELSGHGTGQSAPLAGGEDKKLTLSGTLVATFAGTLSGLTGVGLYLPGGGPGHQVKTKPQTRVTVGFDISLRALRYQDDRVVPDENNADDREKARNKVDEFHGVVPDYRAVVELTNKISAENYYVKSVVEHPPFRDDGRANVVTRVWDIAGRWYDGVFPIDFDINLRGEEEGEGSLGAFRGKTAVQVTVKGAYAKGTTAEKEAAWDTRGTGRNTWEEDVGDELLRKIEETWTGLHREVTKVLADRAGLFNGSRAITAPVEDITQAEFLMEDEDEDEARGPVIVDAVVVEPTPFVVPPSGNDEAYRVADLRKQRKNADDAVMAGRIPEDIYRGIVARIQAELADLGEFS